MSTPNLNYLLIESRDAFESVDVASHHELASDLRRSGAKVTLFLVQNGVLHARRGTARTGLVEDSVKSGVEVLADDLSLRERGLPSAELAHGVHPAAIDLVADRLADGWKTIWF